MLEIRADGIHPDRFIELFSHFEELMPQMIDGARVQTLGTENGFKIVHQRIEMPFLMYNRSFFNCYYEIEGSEPGEYIFVSSGWGNEQWAQRFKRVTKRDVVGTLNLNYYSIRPVKNHYGDVIGTQLQQVNSINLGGSIPDMFKSKMARDQARRITKMLDFLRNR